MTDIHLLTGAYALDALDDIERTQFERHLDGCPDCAEEVSSLREATALLTEDASVAPPAELRDSVLSAIRQVRPLPPVVAAPVRPSGVRNRPSRIPLLVAAAAVVIAGVGGVVWNNWPDDEAPAPTVTQRVLDADDAEREFVDLGEAGRATVVRSVSVDRAVLMTEDMVAPPAGKVYQVWFQTPADDMVPAGTMEPIPDQTLVLDGPASEATAVGITVEPLGGSNAPTSDPIVLFELVEG